MDTLTFKNSPHPQKRAPGPQERRPARKDLRRAKACCVSFGLTGLLVAQNYALHGHLNSRQKHNGNDSDACSVAVSQPKKHYQLCTAADAIEKERTRYCCSCARLPSGPTTSFEIAQQKASTTLTSTVTKVALYPGGLTASLCHVLKDSAQHMVDKKGFGCCRSELHVKWPRSHVYALQLIPSRHK